MIFGNGVYHHTQKHSQQNTVFDLIHKTGQDGHIFAEEENDTFHMHIGGGIYISRSPRLQHIHIRQWYMENGEESKTGVCMMIKQFKQLIDRKSEIQKNLPKEARVSPCYLDADHQNQEGYFMCGYCTPFEYHQTM